MIRKLKSLIGDKKFYMMVLAVAVPIMIQNGITNFVSLLDNIMVGRVGTEEMSGVSIVNQLIFVFNLCVFGGVSGAGVFTAQFFGQKNMQGVQHTFRFKMVASILITVIFSVVFLLFGDELIKLYLHDVEDGVDLVKTAQSAKDYLLIIIIGLIPFGIVQTYVSTLRETGQTLLPMIAGMIAVFVNLILNTILIFGNLGAPKLGVAGAAIATVTSRYVELLIVVLWTHKNKIKNAYIVGIYKTFKIPKALAWKIIVKGTPLLLNEGLWAAGMAMITQCYSLRGMSVVAALNISSTIANLFNVVFIALGCSVSIVVGQKLGAGELEEAKDCANKMIFFAVSSCVGIALIMIGVGRFFPYIYNVTDNVKEIAIGLIIISACVMPMQAYLHATYFTLRSGGKTIVTFLFDSCYMWVIAIPFAFVLSRYTDLPILLLYLLVQLADSIKCVVGFILIKSGIWVNNIVAQDGE